MIPLFTDYHDDFGGALTCPSCKSENLHHDKVEVFECGEDATYGVHVTLENGKAIVDTSLEGNPSLRRHGLKIEFWCEGCGNRSILRLHQHKGTTYIDIK